MNRLLLVPRITICICRYLSLYDTLQLAVLSKTIHQLVIKDTSVWRDKLIQRYGIQYYTLVSETNLNIWTDKPLYMLIWEVANNGAFESQMNAWITIKRIQNKLQFIRYDT